MRTDRPRPTRRALIGAAPAALALASLGGLAAAATGSWKRADSARFILYSDGDEGVLKAYAQKLETFDSLLRFLQGLPPGGVPPRKLPIYLVRDQDDQMRIAPWASGGVQGFYSYGDGDTYAVGIRSRDEDYVLLHEYTHHFMYQYAPFGYPRWLSEGYAEFFMVTRIQAGKIEVGRPNDVRGYALGNVPWMPLEQLLEGKIGPGQGDIFYAQSWLLTHYFLTDGFSANPVRYRQFQAYLKLMGSGTPQAKAMEQALGMSLADLTKALRNYFRSGIKYTPISHSGAAIPPPVITAMSPASDALLPELQRLRSERIEQKDIKGLADTVRSRAARYPGDPLAEIALARAEIVSANPPAAKAVLERRLAADPNHVEALELSARLKLDEAQKVSEGAASDYAKARALAKEAIPFLGRAYKLDQSRYQTLVLIADCGRYLDKSYPSDNTLEALLAAFELAPQVPTIRMEAARGMMRRGRYKEATELLLPLANHPHGGDLADAAKALIEQMKAMQPAAG